MQFRIICKTVGILDSVLLDVDLALYSYDHEITQHMHYVILSCSMKKAFIKSFY